MKITLTGTPGTGKTTVSDKLDEKGYEVVHLSDFLEEQKIGEVVGGEREVPISDMQQKFAEKKCFEEDTVIEGHLAHHIDSDICVVLRCNPEVLEERLSERDYSEQKVSENVEAEALDLILSEAVEEQETVVEIDTTEKDTKETVEKVNRKVEEGVNDYGNVDWTKFL